MFPHLQPEVQQSVALVGELVQFAGMVLEGGGSRGDAGGSGMGEGAYFYEG